MSSPAILYLLSGLLFGASLSLILVAARSSWIRRSFGVERMVEDVLETDFFDKSGEFTRPPSRMSGLFSVTPSGSHSPLQQSDSVATDPSPEQESTAATEQPFLGPTGVAQHDTLPGRVSSQPCSAPPAANGAAVP
jgi:hypothetical protein